ncbi:MAG: hypothetical protein WCA84_06475 [Ignavibacteriaceae bacterium]
MIYKKLSLLLTGIIAILLINSCSENPVSVGIGLLKSDYVNVKEIDSYGDSLKQSSSYFKYDIPITGSAASLLIGKAANVSASYLSEFNISLPDTIGTDILDGAATVTYAGVSLYPNYVFGDSNLAMDFTVNKISYNWTSAGVDADSINSLGIIQADLSTNRTFSDSLVTFNLDKSYVLNILKYASDSTLGIDHGIYFKPTSNSKKVVGFDAVATTSSYTTLKVVLLKPGDYSDTLLFYPGRESSIVTGSIPSISSQDIAVQGGLVINSHLTFNVSSVPANSLINYANLTLNIDTVATIVGYPYLNSLTVLLLTDSTARAYDSTQSIELSRSGNTFQGNIAAYVQNWIDKGVNEGLLLQVTTQNDGLEYYALTGSNAANRALRPRLQITYTGKK